MITLKYMAGRTSWKMPALEAEGGDSPQNRTEPGLLDEWVSGANTHDGFGRWG